MEQVLEHVYLHIGNGGVSFIVSEDTEGRCRLEVTARHFGQKTNGMELLTTPKTLLELGEALIRASQHEFPGKPYCISAEAEKLKENLKTVQT